MPETFPHLTGRTGPVPASRFGALALAMSLSLPNLLAQEDRPPHSSWVEFTSFSYQGNDPVYDANPPAGDEYTNPILAGFYPDPSICRVGEDFYLVNSTAGGFVGTVLGPYARSTRAEFPEK